MKVTLADALGTCFGVQDAIEMVLGAHEDIRSDQTILGELVHNPQTVAQLKEAGVRIAKDLDDNITTSRVVISAHGASERVKDEARARGFEVIDASCPLVMRVHRTIKDFVAKGYFPVVIGQENHVEVRGIVGDLDEYKIILTEEDADELQAYPKVGIVSQTTQPIEQVKRLVEYIKQQGHSDVLFVDTVCKPTKERQIAVDKLAAQVDIMVVIGGHNSSNTKKLKLVCEKKGVPAYHVSCADEVEPSWFEGDEHVGITAGTSTPAHVIQEVYNRLIEL